jgi:hypothetical protein
MIKKLSDDLSNYTGSVIDNLNLGINYSGTSDTSDTSDITDTTTTIDWSNIGTTLFNDATSLITSWVNASISNSTAKATLASQSLSASVAISSNESQRTMYTVLGLGIIAIAGVAAVAVIKK